MRAYTLLLLLQSFAKTGNPNSAGLFPWPQVDSSADMRLQFAAASSVIANFRALECAHWRLQYDAAF
jgi:carboxylesterase type B